MSDADRDHERETHRLAVDIAGSLRVLADAAHERNDGDLGALLRLLADRADDLTEMMPTGFRRADDADGDRRTDEAANPAS